MADAVRQICGSIGGNTYASRVSDWSEAMAAAWQGKTERFERQVDPDGTLSPDERARRAKSAQRAEMSRIALLRWQRRREAQGVAAEGGPR